MELSKHELTTVLGIAGRLLQADDHDCIDAALADVHHLVPFDAAVIGVLHVHAGLVKSIESVRGFNYDPATLELYRDESYVTADAIVRYALSDRRPFQFKHARYIYAGGGHASDSCDHNGIACSVSTRRAMGRLTLLSLSLSRESVSQRYATALTYLVPHFHEACVRLAEDRDKPPQTPVPLLTSRERDILRWIRDGKGTWETSRILAISERTVKFHISNIMAKLDASNRSHAVAKALRFGLI